MNNLISIVLPIYNVEHYLDKCMDSLLHQTYPYFEIIMVDDGSNEVCSMLCDHYESVDDRIRVFHKSNGGLSDARNYGISKAKGEYITCVDSDDYVDEDYLEYLISLITKYHTKMSIAQHRIISSNGNKDLGSNGDEVLTNKVCLERMFYHDVIDTSAWAKLYHRSLFDTVKYPEGKIFEDIGTTYKLMLQCDEISVGYESKYTYVLHENSIVNSEFTSAKLDLLEMTDQCVDNVCNRFPDLIKAGMCRRVYARFSTLNQMVNTDDFKDIRSDLISFIMKNKSSILGNPKAPKRDKIAIRLLSINYGLYKKCWKYYKKK